MDKPQRLKLIDAVKHEQNKARKQWSWRANEVQQGRLQQLVKENLEGQFNEQSVREMPIVSSINVQKRIVDRKATIYKSAPDRKFTELSDDQHEIMETIYRDGKFNQKLNAANKDFIYQDQTIGMIVPCSRTRKLKMRILKMHQIDVIANKVDPEMADGFILSVFDREFYDQLYEEKVQRDTATGKDGRSVRSAAYATQGKDNPLAGEYQYKKYVEQYIVWTPEHNFMMNGHGELIDMATGEETNQSVEDFPNPLAEFGLMPFFEVSRDKDYEYFVRSGYPLTEFTVQFNATLSDLQNNIKLNGYAVGVLKAPSDLQPQNQVVGAAMLLKLPTDDPEKEVDFSFVSPNSSIGEISQATDQFLNYFVTTMGEDKGAINSSGEGEKHPSGMDRFISMIDRLQASKDDYEIFKNAEYQVYEIVKAWISVLSGSNQLDRRYWINSIPQESRVVCNFAKPEMIQTEEQRLANFEKRRDLGITSRVRMIMQELNLSKEEAEQELREIETEDGIGTNGRQNGSLPIGNAPGDQS